MNDAVLRPKGQTTRPMFVSPDDRALPLGLSVAVWLGLAAASWAAVYGIFALIL